MQGGGVLKTLLDRKLITTAGRKAVIGKPILYKTTKDFLLQFGLKDLAELPSLKEFEELRRLALSDDEPLGMPTPEERAAEEKGEDTEADEVIAAAPAPVESSAPENSSEAEEVSSEEPVREEPSSEEPVQEAHADENQSDNAEELPPDEETESKNNG